MSRLQKVLLFLPSILFISCNSLIEPAKKDYRIAFLSFQNNIERLYVIDDDGANEQLLTDSTLDCRFPAWSPDAKQIVFIGNGGICFSNLSVNSSIRRLPISASLSPVWFASGTRLLFSSLRVHIVDTSGLNLRSITSVDRTSGVSDAFPDLSPDQQKIVYINRLSGRAQLHIVNVDRLGERQLTNNVWNNINPRWSPDNKKILFESNRNQQSDIYVLDVETGFEEQLTKSGGSLASWSPDGKKIAFIRNQNLFVMDSNGSNQKQLTNSNDATFSADPQWSPDGMRIAYVGNNLLNTVQVDGSNKKQISMKYLRGTFRSVSWSPK